MTPHPADVLPAAPPDAVHMPNAIVNGISIDYSMAGDGPPVLLICGTGQPADLWFAQVADLTAAGHTVITFDNRGCGRSQAPPAPYLVADMAADTAGLIDHLGLGPCVRPRGAFPAAATPNCPGWATVPRCWLPARSTPSLRSSSTRKSRLVSRCGR